MRSDLVPRRRPRRGVGVPRRGACRPRGEGAVPADQVLGVAPGADGENAENGMRSRRHHWG